MYATSRGYDKRREGRYPALTIPCTNALRKICAVNYGVLSFFINGFRITKDLMIDANGFVVHRI